jgi:DNA-binding transcriptional LysR family regulator
MPSLDQLKGFVAVGRRMSITLAAEDLCITQSAMSKQVRALEDMLGKRLLERGYRCVRLTPDGERLFRIANGSVQQLQDALGTFSMPVKVPVTITSTVGFASLWLLPRLRDFQRRHPGIDVRIAACNAVLQLVPGETDLAVRYCASDRAPRGATRLFGETIAAVASPSLGDRSLRTARDLREEVLLEYDDKAYWLRWADWLGVRGLHPSQARGILRFNHYDLAIHAALAGQGIALGRLELLQPMIDQGRLKIVDRLDLQHDADRAHWLVQANAEPSPEVRKVVDWILFEARALAPHNAAYAAA